MTCRTAVSRWFAKGIRYFKRLLLQMEACSKHKQNKNNGIYKRGYDKKKFEIFLICFPMDYRDFSVKSKVIIHCFKH